MALEILEGSNETTVYLCDVIKAVFYPSKGDPTGKLAATKAFQPALITMDGMTREEYINYELELESLELNFAQGQETDEMIKRHEYLDFILRLAPWTIDMDCMDSSGGLAKRVIPILKENIL